MKKLLSLILISVFLGCVSTNPPVNPPPITIVLPEQNAKFVAFVKIAQGMLSIGGKAALQYAVSSEDRQEIKALLSGSGHVFTALQNGTEPDADDIHNALSAYFPTTSSKYETVAALGAQAWKYIQPIIDAYIPNSDSIVRIRYVNYCLKALAETSYELGDS